MQNDYTNEQLHITFQNYLLERFDGDCREADLMLEIAECVIPNTLNDYFGTQFKSLYELQDVNEIETFRKKIKAHPILKGIDMNEEPRYTEVLKWYRLFVRALSTDSLPVPVPGEYDQQKGQEEKPSVVSEEKPLPLKQKTIFTEGEDDGTISVEHRKRNMELRQACINYFKQQHGGKLVCECCGFDYRKVYDIDDEYIEVHHRFPFAHTDGEHEVDATTDLVPLCANCHRMIHHGMGGRGKCMSLENLKKKLK